MRQKHLVAADLSDLIAARPLLATIWLNMSQKENPKSFVAIISNLPSLGNTIAKLPGGNSSLGKISTSCQRNWIHVRLSGVV